MPLAPIFYGDFWPPLRCSQPIRWRGARDHFNINNHTFGEKYFHAEIPGGGMYRIYLTALAFFVGFVAVAGSIFYFLKDAHLDWKNPVTAAPYFLILGGAYLFGLLFLTTYIGTSVFNLAINRTQLADRFQLESGLSPLQMTWIAFSNLAFVIVTLGLFWPWAQVRLARYRADHFAISGPADLAGFTSEFVTGQGAIGEEVASFFDIDIGL